MRRQWAALAVALAAVVLAASLVPASGGERFPIGADKVAHVAGYAAIAFAAGTALEDGGDSDRALVGVVLAVTAFGAGVELLQPTVGRAASLGDAAANLAGATLGALAARLRRRG